MPKLAVYRRIPPDSVSSRTGRSRIDSCRKNIESGDNQLRRARSRSGLSDWPSDRNQAAFRRGAGALVVEQLGAACLFFIRQAVRIFGRNAGGHREPTLHAGTVVQFVEPALELLEVVDVLALALPVHGPWEANHVGDRVLIAGEIAPVIEAVVQHAIEPVGLVGET